MRRSNMASCISEEGFLYIFGGQDLKEGPLGDLWRVNLEDAMNGNANWEDLTNVPLDKPQYNFSHHCAVYY